MPWLRGRPRGLCFVRERRSLFEGEQQPKRVSGLCCRDGVVVDGCLFVGRVSSGLALFSAEGRWKGKGNRARALWVVPPKLDAVGELN